MWITGGPSPRPLQWWAQWVHTLVFGLLAAFLTYGATTYGLPAERGGGIGWSIVIAMWLLPAAAFVTASIKTIRHLRGRNRRE